MYVASDIHTCHSKSCIADIEIWCYNPVVSIVGFFYIEDIKRSSEAILISNRDSDHVTSLCIYSFCDISIL